MFSRSTLSLKKEKLSYFCGLPQEVPEINELAKSNFRVPCGLPLTV